jgi:uncharacterized protein (DUF1501 family)
MTKFKKNRRDFMKMAGLVSAGLSTAGSSLFNLKHLGALAGQNAIGGPGDYKALVCLYLGGGADSFNMLVPRGVSEYAEYATTRSNQALQRDNLLPISPMNIAGVEYGLHPSMTNIQSMFNNGNACMLSNVGTLVQHVTKQEIYDDQANLPLGLFSHSDQTNQWQTASPSERLIKGWAGRMSDMMHDINSNDVISMNVSFNGSNTFQSSDMNVEYTVNANGAVSLNGYEDMYGAGPVRRDAIDKIIGFDHADPFKKTYNAKFRQTIDANLQFTEAINNVPDLNTQFSDDYLSQNFSMVSKIIAAHEELGFKRQIFFLDFGNWDNHDELLNTQAYNLMVVDQALSEFNQALEELGMGNDVVTFTMSEFGRTLTSNGNGTDHAWGGNALGLGGPVKGKALYGEYPSLALNGELELGGGVLIPTTPNDLYFAELAMWYGVEPSELHNIFPNLSNFYSQGSTHQPINFLNL